MVDENVTVRHNKATTEEIVEEMLALNQHNKDLIKQPELLTAYMTKNKDGSIQDWRIIGRGIMKLPESFGDLELRVAILFFPVSPQYVLESSRTVFAGRSLAGHQSPYDTP